MALPVITIKAFNGETPAVDPRLIDDNIAAESINTWLFSGRIEPVHSLVPVHVMNDPANRSWFRYPKVDVGIDNMASSYWMEFDNENVRVVRSPVAGADDNGRFYWCDGVYPKYVTGDMIVAALGGSTPAQPVPWRLGIPAPTTPPGVTPLGVGVSSTTKTVSYVYTWVSAYGEEGPPSPPTTVDGLIDDTYTVTVSAPLPADTDHRNLTLTRIYRTVVSAQGVAVYFFVVELPIATLTYDDDCAVAPDSVIVDNEQLPSLEWNGPPDDLQGMVTLPNGMIAGWRANEVWFCESYKPHAWPIKFIIAVDANIVGLGVHEQSVIILTAGQSYAATGVVPEAMALSKIQPMEPCTSRRSIVNTPAGVLYCSYNGLINITARGAENLTRELILKDQWSKRLNLNSVVATTLTNGYYCFSGPTAGVFQPDAFQDDAFQFESAFGTKPGMFIHRKYGVTTLDPAPSQVFNLIQDLFNGETMQLRDGIVYFVDLRDQAPYARYRWRSKIFTLPYLQNMGAAKVYWVPADPRAPNEPNWFRVYAGATATHDNALTLRFQQQMTQSGQMFRLPSGYKALYYQFEVEGYLTVDAIHCAQTARELRKF